jgi:hypothetical protein
VAVVLVRRNIGAWRSLVAHLLREQGVGGSNPLAPTTSRSCVANQGRVFKSGPVERCVDMGMVGVGGLWVSGARTGTEFQEGRLAQR